MRILVDTNVLFSSLLFPNSKPAIAVRDIVDHHTLLLAEQNVRELRDIVKKKMPSLCDAMESFLTNLSYELVMPSTYPLGGIRDESDEPILSAAVNADADIIVTGDKDFLSLAIQKPLCITPSQYIDLYIARP